MMKTTASPSSIKRAAISWLLMACALVLSPTLSNAQEVVEQYTATIAPQDRVNSSGAALDDIAAILAQDRANFHRFGIRHGGDESDPYFANKQLRAGISELYRRGPGAQQYIVDAVLSGQAKSALARPMGTGGVPRHPEASDAVA